MNYRTAFLLLTSLFVFISIPVYGHSPKTGLYFHSHDQNIDSRTSLILNNNEAYDLNPQEEFTISSDVYLRDVLVKFGYIVRIISNKNENFDLMINNDLKLILVINNQDYILKNNLLVKEWNHLGITFNKGQKLIRLRLNDEIIDCPYDMDAVKSLHVNFGRCKIKGFMTDDVSPIILKDISVKNNNKEVHHWALGRHGNNIVYDELKGEPAIVTNPYWLIDDHAYWTKAKEFTTDLFPQVTFDSIHNALYILGSSNIIKYSLEKEEIEHLPVGSNPPFNLLYNNFIYDPVFNQLLYYTFDTEKLYRYSLNKEEWEEPTEQQTEATHAHNNRYISQRDSSLYLFGGYGHYTYQSDFVKVDLTNNERTTYDFSHIITPRYLAAMGANKAGDKVYVLGGRGAERGRQELSPKNFSDFYEIDLRTGKATHLFNIDKGDKEETWVYSNSLVVDEEDNCFYVFAYPFNDYASNIQLLRISMETGEVEELANPVEFIFRDIFSFCDLYYSPSLSKLIALVAYSEDQVTAKVYLYTLDYPPLATNEVDQVVPTKSNKSLLYIAIAVALLIAALLLIWEIKRRRKASAPAPTDHLSFEGDNTDLEIMKEVSHYDIRTKAIYFLGGFQVFDKEGNDITGKFTPTLKHLFVLIVLSSSSNNKGISSNKLQELLWSDKSEESARNNRSVNLRKLRVLLEEEIGDIDIINNNGYWSITPFDDVFCDYAEALNLIHHIQEKELVEKTDLLRLLELLNKGAFLPNIQNEWVDDFKTSFSNRVIDLLMQVINNPKDVYKNNPTIQLKIAHAILTLDTLNEDALAIKCQALCSMGKKGLAKSAFDAFAKEYKTSMGEPYSASLKDILSQAQQ